MISLSTNENGLKLLDIENKKYKICPKKCKIMTSYFYSLLLKRIFIFRKVGKHYLLVQFKNKSASVATTYETNFFFTLHKKM